MKHLKTIIQVVFVILGIIFIEEIINIIGTLLSFIDSTIKEYSLVFLIIILLLLYFYNVEKKKAEKFNKEAEGYAKRIREMLEEDQASEIKSLE